MRPRALVTGLALVVGVGLGVVLDEVVSASRRGNPSLRPSTDTSAALEAIRSLHRADSAATLTGDPDSLATLWAPQAVRLEPGGEVDVGRAAIHASDTRSRREHPGSGMTRYVPRIVAIELHGDWAVEWGYFDAAYVPGRGAPSLSFRGKVLRVLQRQPDGAWKFTHVMWNMAE